MMARFIHAIWLGSGIFLLLAAQAAFKVASSPTAAASYVGALLDRWHYIALAAPIALLVLEWKRARASVLLIIFAGVLFAATQVAVDLRIRAIRATSPVPISELSRQDPIRRTFGRLHGISTLLLLAQIAAAAAALAVDREAWEGRGARRLAAAASASELPQSESGGEPPHSEITQ
ncbi:MAG TPA: hypothetical protein VM779_00285 [Thermoanaerobaculia bacterium]|nr:hypothetical protein [Thermoanaerobaculia bacterium]